MAKKTNPKLIGAFVVGGIALAIAGMLAFGGGQYFTKKAAAVTYFEGSLAGLAVGAPVNFRGVKIGTVTNITILYDITDQTVQIPVQLELEPEKLQIVRGERSERNLGALIERGLRAQLQVQSLVTGQASIELDFHPETPIRLLSPDKSIAEIPTIPSTMDELQANIAAVLEKLSKMPLDEIVNNVNQAIDDLRELLDSGDALVKDLDSDLDPLMQDVKTAVAAAKELMATANARLGLQPGEPLQTLNVTLEEYRALAHQLQGQVGPLGTGLQAAIESLNKGLTSLEQIAALAERDYARNPALVTQVADTLRDARSMLGALRALAEYLQRNPNALLTGKQ
jgi:paraquat-inducible protein B